MDRHILALDLKLDGERTDLDYLADVETESKRSRIANISPEASQAQRYSGHELFHISP